MKVFVMFFLLTVALTACGPQSSPEGRMTIKLNELKQQIDSLKEQNAAIKDSLGQLSTQLRSLKK